jgi:hypothetical protein
MTAEDALARIPAAPRLQALKHSGLLHIRVVCSGTQCRADRSQRAMNRAATIIVVSLPIILLLAGFATGAVNFILH